MITMEQLFDGVPDNTPLTVVESMIKANSVVSRYLHPACSISGGSDSDIMLDILMRVDPERRIEYVWFDTGIEYQATKDHLRYLEQRYGITIRREKAIKAIPLSVKEFGQPFLSKFVSEMICRLQAKGFKWEDEPFEVLMKRYPRCKAALSWWCNRRTDEEYGISRFDVGYNKHLKEFMHENPPWFKISNQCCNWAKKEVSYQFIKENHIDCMIVGIRKSEGGIRAGKYKTCFSNGKDGCDYFRPIFWYKDTDKKAYEEIFGIHHSDCYEKYGMRRTGCVGCPYNRSIDDELKAIETYEPRLARVTQSCFSDAYEYTRMYREFCKEKDHWKRKSGEKNSVWLDRLLE